MTVQVDGEVREKINIVWEEQVVRPGLREPRDFAEYGALAIAFYLATKFFEYEVVEQPVIGSGFDYWPVYKSTHPNYNTNNFLNARLEVSGILNGTESEVKTRLGTRHQ